MTEAPTLKPSKPIRKTPPIVLRKFTLTDLWRASPLLRLWAYAYVVMALFAAVRWGFF